MFAYPNNANAIPVVPAAPPNPFCTINVHPYGGPPLVLNTRKDVADQFPELTPAVHRRDQQLHLHVLTQQGT